MDPFNAQPRLRKKRRGIDELCQAVILGSNGDLTSLTEAPRRRTEAILTRMAQRFALGEPEDAPSVAGG